jgi:hypothetical protein
MRQSRAARVTWHAQKTQGKSVNSWNVRRGNREKGTARNHTMKQNNPLRVTLAIVASLTITSPAVVHGDEAAKSQAAKEVNQANPYVQIDEEPAPKLFVDQPDPKALAQGILWIQYRVENVRILPIFDKGARTVSPRVGHLHIHIDDVGWWWADSSGLNTIDVAGLKPGEHKIKIELVDPTHKVFPGETKTVTFTVPESARGHAH